MGTQRNVYKLTVNKLTGNRKMGSDVRRYQILKQSAGRRWKDEKCNKY